MPPEDPSEPAPDPDVPGFPYCQQCRYKLAGPAAQCAWCAHRSIQGAGWAGHCRVCCQMLSPGYPCMNRLCRDPERAFGRVSAIAMKSGPLHDTIHRYKYQQKSGWALIFARLLLGHLDHTGELADADLIVAAPTWTGPPRSRYAHTEAVLDAAAAADTLDRWPFDDRSPRAIVATGPRPASAGSGYAGKQEAARCLASVLHVPAPSRVHGKRILVYDDVFTTGLTLHVIAQALRTAGAIDVNAIVLARQPWQEQE